MLTNKMSLIEMLNFKPDEMDMLSLPIEAITYIKVSVVSLYKEDNYDFIRYLFTIEDFKDNFLDYTTTIFHDFDATNTNQSRFVTIFELYSLYSYANVSEYLKEIMEDYNHIADVIFDFYTHDNKEYRMSNLDGIVKLERILNTKSA